MKNNQDSFTPPKTKETFNKGIQPKKPIESISRPPAKKNSQSLTQNKKK